MFNIPKSISRLARRLCHDDAGLVESSGYMLLTTILGVGILVGLATLRDQVVQEFGDIAESIEELDQSYSVTYSNGTGGVLKTIVFDEDMPPAPVPGPVFPMATPENNPSGTPPAGLSLTEPAAAESN